MEIVPAIGSVCFGSVIGWLVRYFIRRFKKVTPQTLMSVISVIAGGVIVKFLESSTTAVWFYSIGLFLGFVIYSVVAFIAIGRTSEPEKDEDESASDKSAKTITPKKKIPKTYDGVLYSPRNDKTDQES